MTYITYKTNLFLVVTLLFSVLAVAQEEPPFSFKTHVIFDKALDARSVAVADIDGDDRIDVLSASSADNTIRWYKNTKTDEGIVFEVNTIFNDAQGVFSITTADIDGDMNVDVVSASPTDNTIRWYKNLGDGVFTDAEDNFTDHTIFSSAMGTRSVAVTDIDGDGRTDVVSASTGDDSIRWYKNSLSTEIEGDIVFTDHLITNEADGAFLVTIADVDGDTVLDIVSISDNDGTIRWHKKLAEGFSTHTIHSSSWGAYSAAVADIDGDMDMDVVTSLHYDDGVRLFKNNGEEMFTAQNIPPRITAAYSVALVDIDGDEHLDLFVGYGGYIRWFKNDGQGDYINHYPIYDDTVEATTGTIPSIAIADLDGDGDLDVVSGAIGDNTIRWHENDLVSLNVEKVLPQTITLYPNPTSSAINLSHATATSTNYSLYDLSGKRLATYEQSGTAHQLDVSSVSKGTYILKAISGLQVNYYRIVKE